MSPHTWTKSILFIAVGAVAALALAFACSRTEEAPAPVTAAPAEPAATVAAPPAPVAEPARSEPLAPELAARLVRPHSPVLGPANAPVTLVEFLDPACEACAAFSPIVKQIQLLYADDVRVVVRYAAFHQGSDEAVRLLEAARMQGKFDEALTALFNGQPEWAAHHAPDTERAWQIVEATGVNLARARRDAKSAKADAVLRIDAEDVVALKVDRTPTFFVNGRPMTEFGPKPLIAMVQAEIERSREKTAPTP